MNNSSSNNDNNNNNKNNNNNNNNKQQTTNNKQQTTNNKQPTTNNQQPTTNNKQQTTNNKQTTTKTPCIPTEKFEASTSSSVSPFQWPPFHLLLLVGQNLWSHPLVSVPCSSMTCSPHQGSTVSPFHMWPIAWVVASRAKEHCWSEHSPGRVLTLTPRARNDVRKRTR